MSMIWPFAFALAGAVVALAADAFVSHRAASLAATLGLGLAAAIAFYQSATVSSQAGIWGLWHGAGFSAASGFVFMLAAAACAIGLSRDDVGSLGGFAPLVALAGVGAAVVVSSAELMTTFLAIEAVSLAGYGLVAAGRTRRASEAAMKYFIQGSVAAAIFILGIAGVVGVKASTSLAQWGGAAGMGVLTFIGGAVLVGVALSFKAGAFPFHAWVPDVYEGAPARSTAFLSSGAKIAAITALALLGSAATRFIQVAPAWIGVMTALAAVSVVFGNLVALRQTSYTRMLGYSSIAQAGYAFVALSALSATSAILMVCTYAVASSAAFAAAEAVQRVRPDWDGTIAGLAGLGRTNPVLSASVSVAMFSLVGVPPFIGFWGKIQAFGAAVTAGSWWLALLAVIGSVVSFGYYGRVLRAMYFENAPTDPDSAETRDVGAAGVVTVALAVLILIAGVAPLIFGTSWIAKLFEI